MPLYTCRFCNNTTTRKNIYYNHLCKHIKEHASSFDSEELTLCQYYKEKNLQRDKEYYLKNKEKILQYKKQYNLNKKLEKQQNNEMIISDDEIIISDDE